MSLSQTWLREDLAKVLELDTPLHVDLSINIIHSSPRVNSWGVVKGKQT